jgi:hypothetical protein
MDIDFINGYYISGYWWLLMVIILVIIDEYFINGYWWIFYYASEFVILRLWRVYWILNNLCHWKFNENLKIQLTLVGSQATLVHSMPQGLFCPNYIYEKYGCSNWIPNVCV